MRKKKKEEYNYIYDDDHDIDYSELSESSDPEEEIEKLRGTISKGSCMYCGKKDGMKYDEICFICSYCGRAVHEDLYYRWAAGYPIDLGDDFDDVY